MRNYIKRITDSLKRNIDELSNNPPMNINRTIQFPTPETSPRPPSRTIPPLENNPLPPL